MLRIGVDGSMYSHNVTDENLRPSLPGSTKQVVGGYHDRMMNLVFVLSYFSLWRSQILVGPVGAWWTMFVLVPSVHRLS